MVALTSLVLAFTLGLAAADTATMCGPNNLCPKEAPCCSQYGQCGVGAYCLGGCDPLFSHSLDSCAPAPVCKSENYKLNSLNDVMPNDKYLGNASAANWVSQGSPVVYDNGVLLTMAPDTVGTLLTSTHYVWYGKISTTMKTSQGAGVVTAFIMMSDVKDELDFEFVGTDVQHVQSNFYWQGVLNYTNEVNLTAANTESQTHTYTFDWKPDSVTWAVDGTVLRTLNRADTFNSTTNSYQYPQTPARVQLSLWPAGESQEGKGTVEWAGGLINWNSPYMTNGYYSAQVTEVDVECYDPPSGANVTGSESYVYNNIKGLQSNVAITNENTELGNFYATGENPEVNSNGSPSSSAGAPVNTAVNTVPGVSGGGNRGTDSSSSDSTSSGSSGSGSSSGSGPSINGGTNGQFIQGNSQGGSGGSSGASAGNGEQAIKGSMFAVLVAIFALISM